MTRRTLAGIAGHPNVAGVLVLSLSLASGEELAARVRATGAPVEVLGLQESGSALAMTMEGVRIATRMVLAASELAREPCPLEALTVGVECGGSDTTSGLASNPAVGRFSDRLVDSGGTIILSEPAEFMGAEHILAARAVNADDARKIVDMVRWFEDEANATEWTCGGRTPLPTTSKGG